MPTRRSARIPAVSILLALEDSSTSNTINTNTPTTTTTTIPITSSKRPYYNSTNTI